MVQGIEDGTFELIQSYDYRPEVDFQDPSRVVIETHDSIHVYNVEDVLCVATSPGMLGVLLKTGQLAYFYVSMIVSQHTPIELFMDGPSDGLELTAVWGEYRQRLTAEGR